LSSWEANATPPSTTEANRSLKPVAENGSDPSGGKFLRGRVSQVEEQGAKSDNEKEAGNEDLHAEADRVLGHRLIPTRLVSELLLLAVVPLRALLSNDLSRPTEAIAKPVLAFHDDGSP
jgi:hypothetical protein